MAGPGPEFVTFTGVDAHTDVEGLLAIQATRPVEWGVLFSPKRQGTGRYPPHDVVASLAGRGLRLAAHVCGDHAAEVVATGRCPTVECLPHGMFSRVQVNTSDHAARPATVAAFAGRVGAARGILQARGAFPEDTDVDWLFDRSGGRGVVPSHWPAPSEYAALVGYAGGMGPETVAAALDGIRAANPDGRPYWIDMENRVRDGSDRLDLGMCRSVLDIAFPG